MTRDWYCRDDMPFLAEHTLIIPDWCPNQHPPSNETSCSQQPELIRHADTEKMMEENICSFSHREVDSNYISIEIENRQITDPQTLEPDQVDPQDVNPSKSLDELQAELDILTKQFDEDYALAAPTIIEDPDTVLNLKEDDDEWEDGKHVTPYKLHYLIFYK